MFFLGFFIRITDVWLPWSVLLFISCFTVGILRELFDFEDDRQCNSVYKPL